MTDTPQRHARRAAVYGYASAALQYPDDETVADLTDEATRQSLRTAADALGLGEEMERLQRALAATSQEALETSYGSLFGIPGDGTYPVVPYEANYTVEGEVNAVQRRIATVVGLLETFGLQPSDDFDERPDHVAVELELLQVVATQRAIALEEGTDDVADRLARAEATILDEHLTGFLPPLSTAVDRTADSECYRAATDLAAALVARDAARGPAPGPADRSPEEGRL